MRLRIATHLAWRIDHWRRHELQRSLASLGTGSWLGSRVVVHSPGRLTVGDHSEINDFTLIFAAGDVEIGSFVLISSGCNITSVTHAKDPAERRAGGLVKAPVRICDGVWLGAGAIVLPGITIGENAIVGAGAVVTHDVGPGETVVGVPATSVSRRVGPATP